MMDVLIRLLKFLHCFQCLVHYRLLRTVKFFNQIAALSDINSVFFYFPEKTVKSSLQFDPGIPKHKLIVKVFLILLCITSIPHGFCCQLRLLRQLSVLRLRNLLRPGKEIDKGKNKNQNGKHKSHKICSWKCWFLHV